LDYFPVRDPAINGSELEMKRMALVGLTALALAILGVNAAPSLAAPTVSELSGESVKEPTSTGEQVSTDTLETELKETISATLEKLRFVWIGVFPFVFFEWVHEFTGTKMNKAACNTEGAPAETVFFKGKGEVVTLSLSPLKMGFLIKPNETTILCNGGKSKVKVKGTFLESFDSTLNVDLMSFQGKLKGKAGKPELTTYFNSEGKETKASLTCNFGLGFENCNFNIEKAVEYKNSSMLIFED
jgi:hypothetical protein